MLIFVFKSSFIDWNRTIIIVKRIRFPIYIRIRLTAKEESWGKVTLKMSRCYASVNFFDWGTTQDMKRIWTCQQNNYQYYLLFRVFKWKRWVIRLNTGKYEIRRSFSDENKTYESTLNDSDSEKLSQELKRFLFICSRISLK